MFLIGGIFFYCDEIFEVGVCSDGNVLCLMVIVWFGGFKYEYVDC